jgi:hypothetical protein
MTWQLVQSGIRISLQVGQFAVRQTTNSVKMPKQFVGKQANWYLDKELKIGKMKLEKDGMKKVAVCSMMPKLMKETIGDQAVVYLDEDSMYFCPYKLGQEYLTKFLKKEGIL